MVCCKCNRTDLCRGCACVKAGRSCVNCLPSKLGNCANATSNAPQVRCTEQRLLSNGMGARRMRNYIGDIQLSMRKANFVIRMFAAVAQDALDSQRYSLVQGFAESLQHASAKR